MNQKKKLFGLKRKHFIIALLSLCGALVIAEAVLLAVTFSKKKSPKKTGGNEPSVTGEAGEQTEHEKKEYVWRPVKYRETLYGHLTEDLTIEYDNQGRIKHITGASDELSLEYVLTYEKSGVIMSVVDEDGEKEVYFIRDLYDQLTGESTFRVKTGEYELERDEQGYWKRVAYKITENRLVTVYGRDFVYDDAGRMAGYTDWKMVTGFETEEIAQNTSTYAYDEQGRISRVEVKLLNMLMSYPSPGEYVYEYGDGWKTETRYVDGEAVTVTRWDYFEGGTLFVTDYSQNDPEEATRKIGWIFKMPDSYTGIVGDEKTTSPTFESLGNLEYTVSYDEKKGAAQMILRNRAMGAEQVAKKYFYDEKGRIAEIWNGDEETRQFTYDENGNVTRVTEKDGENTVSEIELEYQKIFLSKS